MNKLKIFLKLNIRGKDRPTWRDATDLNRDVSASSRDAVELIFQKVVKSQKFSYNLPDLDDDLIQCVWWELGGLLSIFFV